LSNLGALVHITIYGTLQIRITGNTVTSCFCRWLTASQSVWSSLELGRLPDD